MTEKMLARVAVSSVPYAADRLYTYLVPDELIGSAEAGKRVTIPFGRGNRRSSQSTLFSTMRRCWMQRTSALCGG